MQVLLNSTNRTTILSGDHTVLSGSNSRHRRGFGSLASVLLAGASVAGIVSPDHARAQEAASTAARSFNIPAQSLADALADFGRQSGLQVSVNANEVRGLTAPAVAGTMPPAEALGRLLAGSGLSFRIEGRVVSLTRAPKAADGVITLDPLRVQGTTPDALAVTETGAERDARRKDAVYDLDMSTSFANREEVERYKGVNTADVLKGMVNVFSGDARNGGALDPSIRGVQGPGRVPVIIDGTEQALVVWRGYNGAGNRSYIDPSLIAGVQVLKGPVSTRDANGSTGGAVVINTLDANDILKPEQRFGIEMKIEGGNNATSPRLPTLLTGQDYRTVPGFLGANGTDSPTYPYSDPSLRVALRTSDDNQLLSFGDQALRIAAAGRLGNLDLFGAYAWRERGNYFSGKNGAGYYQQEEGRLEASTYIRKLGLNYEPGNEVPNTSSESESWLFKAGWHIADDHALQFGFRDTKSKFGEIMPSRIMQAGGGKFGDAQWPLSKVHAQAWNGEYRWQPDSRWIDLKVNGWATHTISDTYSSGGFPNAASVDDPIIVNTAISNSVNDRYGFSASNQFRLTSRLDLIIAGDWSHEKLTSGDGYTTAAANGWRALPRAGRREEWRIDMKAEWRPVDFVKFNAGLTYSGYWAKDDFLAEYIALKGGSLSYWVPTSYTASYKTTEFGAEAYEAWLRSQGASDRVIQRRLATYNANPVPFEVSHADAWAPDENGKYSRTTNICVNGTVAALSNYVANSCAIVSNVTEVTVTQAKRKSADGWAPSFSATAYLSSTSRAYVRYAEAYRFPSMFESTIGFSASVNPTEELKPEHLRSWELAFIQDLRPLFGLNGGDQHADVKLTWYHNTTHNVIDRDSNLMFSNIDRQTIAGFELQARFDNGRFFTEIGAGHMTTNKVCDADQAILTDPQGRIPDCVKYGFVTSYLLTQATPEDTINWSLGGRFFKRRLELGGRLSWFSEYNNPQLSEFSSECLGGSCVLNIPYVWGETLTLDAYARFRVNDRFTAELTGTNLTDRYYVDPLSRSMLPAPGRMVRASLTGRF
jgi:hemoglobin/transferrin/lactoferrin receptor protein